MTQHMRTEDTRGGAGSAAPLSALHATLFARLDSSIAALWAGAHSGLFWRHVTDRGCSPELYRLTMLQIFHYTQHNSINQALAAFRADPEQLPLLRFVYEHAREELGHERLVLRDLKSAGLLRDGEPLDPPLPATDALIHYLYGISLRDGPVPRLGYSYWAESVYAQINPLLRSVRESLALSARDLSFFHAHSEIDQRHSRQVREAIERSVTTDQQADALHRVAVTSLWLTLQLLEQAFGAAQAKSMAG
jgi:pyrroloquinoline quinone (PQQ) biosynthesis protein C